MGDSVNSTGVEEGEWFSPEQMARHRNIVLAIFSVVVLLPVAGFVFFLDSMLGAATTFFLALPVLFMVWYNGKFEESAFYRFTDENIHYKRGVWIKKQSSVPYDRITNAESSQGPILRFIGAGAVQVHTAGKGTPQAEMKFSGVENFEEIENKVMEKVREKKPQAMEAGEHESSSIDQQMLSELRKIRQLLEEE
ncbi:MAG: PH domain-containing protein [Candidatus Nanohaloarchaea archaeon]